MEGAARVFAGDLTQSTLSVPDENGNLSWVVTPGGAWCRLVYLCGALTEVVRIGRCAVLPACRSLPGAFTLVSGGRKAALAEQIRALPVPSFIAVTGTAHLTIKRTAGVRLVVRPEYIAASDRAGRDRWIVITADMTISRLGLLLDAIDGKKADGRDGTVVRHYCLKKERIREMTTMVEIALAGVRTAPPAQEAPADITGLIMEIVKEKSGPRGVSVDDVVAEAGAKGCTQDAVIAAIRTLVENDDCYQPQKGYVKPL